MKVTFLLKGDRTKITILRSSISEQLELLLIDKFILGTISKSYLTLYYDGQIGEAERRLKND